MTVAIGLVCADGVLVASDSMGSNANIAAHSVKVRAMSHLPMIWTAAGSQYVAEEVEAALAGLDVLNEKGSVSPTFSKPDLMGVRSSLTGRVHPAMKKAYGSYLASEPVPAGGVANDFISDFLLLGYASDTPYFLEYARDGQINWHTEAGFYALGSGGEFATVAQVLMQHYTRENPTLEQGRLVAYRTIEAVCSASSGRVGLPVQIAQVDSTGSRVLDEEEIREIGTAVERWKELEIDTLQALMGGSLADAEVQGDLPSLDQPPG